MAYVNLSIAQYRFMVHQGHCLRQVRMAGDSRKRNEVSFQMLCNLPGTSPSAHSLSGGLGAKLPDYQWLY